MSQTQVVFDIGGVLIDWQPYRAFLAATGSRAEAEAFITRTGFLAINARADNGERFGDMAAELDDPSDQALLRGYVAKFAQTVPDAITGTWEILDALKTRGTPVHAITNWSDETWPEGLKAHPRLGAVFETLVVSGRERLIKPDPAIFHLFCDRAGASPEHCLFIDDTPKNVDGAGDVGMDAIHFTGPAALRRALVSRGLL
ncbi:MAG: HAD family phosphatase [Pseudomonadota bacterium]